MNKLLKLFFIFFKIGLFTFGGGYAMLSLIDKECVDKQKYISKEEFKELIILSEATPGPISINCATFIGYKQAKLLGSIIATLALILPSLIIITIISIFLSFFKDNLFINCIFEAIRASVIILMIQALFNLSKNTQKNLLFFILLIGSFIANFVFNIKAIYIIIFAIILTITYLLFSKFKEVKEHA